MLRLRRAALIVLVLCCALGVARPAWAEKTDYIVLVNGDRLTGEVKMLSKGQLKISTDDLGTLYMEWDKVVAISTLGTFDVATRDGQRYVGRFDVPPAGGLALVGYDGSVSDVPVSRRGRGGPHPGAILRSDRRVGGRRRQLCEVERHLADDARRGRHLPAALVRDVRELLIDPQPEFRHRGYGALPVAVRLRTIFRDRVAHPAARHPRAQQRFSDWSCAARRRW